MSSPQDCVMDHVILSLFSTSHRFLCFSPTGLHIQETEDNEAVVSTVIDLQRLMETKYLPAVRSWCQVLACTQLAHPHILSALYFGYVCQLNELIR